MVWIVFLLKGDVFSLMRTPNGIECLCRIKWYPSFSWFFDIRRIHQNHDRPIAIFNCCNHIFISVFFLAFFIHTLSTYYQIIQIRTHLSTLSNSNSHAFMLSILWSFTLSNRFFSLVDYALPESCWSNFIFYSWKRYCCFSVSGCRWTKSWTKTILLFTFLLFYQHSLPNIEKSTSRILFLFAEF